MSELPQHMVALANANRIRFARAAVKREIAAGERTLEQALDHWACQGMLVRQLLGAQRRWGATRVNRRMAEAGVALSRLVRDLTPRQRKALLDGGLLAASTRAPATVDVERDLWAS